MNKTEMASLTSGKCTSISTTGLPNSGPDPDPRQQQLIDERKRRRRESNRESARRTRIRKHNHLHELAAQINKLRNENNHLIVGIGVTTEHYNTIVEENTILRAEQHELNHRLEYLNEIIVNHGGVGIEKGQGGGDCGGSGGGGDCGGSGGGGFCDGAMNPPRNLGFYNQPNIASASNADQSISRSPLS